MTIAGELVHAWGDDVEDTYPLAPTQQGMLLHTIWEPDTPLFFQQQVIPLRNPDLDAFVEAWQRIVDRHASLRTSFHWEGLDRPIQVVHRDARLPVEHLDWRGLSGGEQRERMRAFLRADRDRGVALGEAPLMRLTMVRLDDQAYLCVRSNHHLLLDAWSGATVASEVQSTYEALRDGRDVLLPEVPPYVDYIRWLERQDLGEAEAYWRAKLAGFNEPTPLPAALRPGPAVDGRALFLARRIVVPASATASLRSLARRAQITPSSAIRGAWALLLSRWSGRDDVVFGATVSGRPADLEGVERMVGLFINALPVRVRVPHELRVEAWLQLIHADQSDERRFEFSPAGDVHAWSELPRSAPLFETLLTFKSQALALGSPASGGGNGIGGNGTGGMREPPRAEPTNQPLSLMVIEGDAEIVIDATADARRYDDGALVRLLEQLRTLIEAIAADPDRRVGDMSPIGAAEAQRVVRDWNLTATDYPRDACLHELFELTAARVPDAVAVRSGTETLSYGALNARANRLARYLSRKGVGGDVLVGVAIERSMELAVAVLAVLKAGGAYVPLDPDYPEARLRLMLEDSRAAVLLTQAALADRWSTFPLPIVRIDSDAPRWRRLPATDPHGRAHPDSLAFVIYTSGSTGTPKGVAQTHRVCVNRMFVEADPFEPGEALPAKTSLGFIDSVWELFSAWTHGLPVTMASRDALRDPVKLVDVLAEAGATRIVLVPSLLRSLLECGEPLDERVPRLRHWICSGEPLPRDLSELFAHRLPAAVLTNLYGTSETWDVTRCDSSELPPEDGLPIGKPMGNLRTYVVDARMAPVPIGVAGDLYVGGDGLARGYYRRPDLTAERFVPDPFSKAPGGRLYRTGDRARWRPDGHLEIVGRADQQLKVRGFRVEPGEVESALRRHPRVRQAVVTATPQQQLAAFVELRAGDDPEPDGTLLDGDLREFCRERLPEHLVPARFIQVASIPLTPSGKVDRRSLRLPDVDAASDPGGHIAPRTREEAAVAATWEEVLRVARVGALDDFFELGGHSLLATQVIARLRQVLGVRIPIQVLFDAPTVAGLAAWIEDHRDETQDAAPVLEAAPASPDGRREAPQSFAQQRLWFLAQLAPGSALYNTLATVPLPGPLDPAALDRALDALVARHESLRTTFATRDGEPVQVVGPPVPLRPAHADLRAAPGPARAAELAALVRSERARPFDLARGPLVRATLARLDEARQVLLLALHHIITDGWSAAILRRETLALYEAFRAGRPSPLPPLALQYADYAAWQRRWLQGPVLDEQLAYWRDQLAGAPYLDLPTDRARPAVPSWRSARRPLTLGPELEASLRRLAAETEATLFMTLLAAWALVLGRYAGQDDVVVGSPIANRTRAELEGVVGFFVNTLALRADLARAPTFRALVEQVRATCLAAYDHQDLPFERLVEELAPRRDLALPPLFSVLFILQNTPGATAEGVPGQAARTGGTAEPADAGLSFFDLTLWLSETGQGLTGAIQYATDLWDAATADRLADHLETLLAAVARDPDRDLAGVSMLAPGERDRLLALGTGRRAGPATGTVHGRFEQVAARTPDAVALEAGGTTLTYAELDRRANRLAHRLVALGVRAEAPVAMCLERSVEAVVSLLAILKAGGAYVPLDPSYPQDRLAFMVADSKPAVVLTEARWLSRMGDAGAPIICLDRDASTWKDEPADRAPTTDAGPADPAYVIYTSGSTGTPKGVLGLHRGILNLVDWVARTYPAATDEVACQKTALSFVDSVWEVFGPLLHGVPTVIVGDDAVKDPVRLVGVLAAGRVTRIVLVPSLLAAILDLPGDLARRLPRLGLFMTSGEALTPALAALFRERLPGRRLVNLYGQSEVAAVVSAWDVDGSTTNGGSIPIGHPIDGAALYVLDRAGQPVPAGTPGDLYATGEGIAAGYLGRPDLTAERFVPDPFGDQPGTRLYRTGDRVRWRSDGELEFLGRVDDQVKVRGFRVELGEVEAVLRSHGGVRDVVVVATDRDQLGAYIVAARSKPPSTADMRKHARRRLPEFMVPSLFMAVDALPMTPSGKVDRRALPPFDAGPGERVYVEPRTFTEQVVAEVWGDLLNRDQVGALDDFFELGGHSLLATQAVARLRFAVGVEVPIAALFDAPTVAGLAAWIEDHRDETQDAAPVLEAAPASPDGRREAPQSFAQQRLWFLAQLAPGSALYNTLATVPLPGPLDPAALDRALDALVARHESLRTTFATRDGEPVQVVGPPVPLRPAHADLRAAPGPARAAELAALVRSERARPFDLARGPLVRATLARLDEARQVLLLALHHIITDGWSAAILRRETLALYEAFRAGRPSPLPPLALQYADYAAWQRRWLQGPVLDEQLAYWRDQLAGAPYLDLPTDRARPAVPSWRSARRPLTLGPELEASLRRLAAETEATLFMTLLAAWALVLGRYAGQDDVVVGSPIANRTRAELEGVVGFFVNTLALRADLARAPTFRALVEQVRATCLAAYDHQDLPFERLVEELAPRRDLALPPLFSVLFILQNTPGATAEGVPGQAARTGGTAEPADAGLSFFDLTLWLSETGQGLTGAIQYATDLWDAATADRLADHLETLLAAVARDPDRDLAGVSMLAPGERDRLLALGTGRRAGPATGTVHGRFEQVAARTPDAVALEAGGTTLTYAELDRRANRLAHRLVALGVRAEAPVAMCLERSVEAVVSLLAILKAGGAYVPLDPSYPQDRLAFMVADSKPAVVLTTSALRTTLPETSAAVVCVDAVEPHLADERAGPPPVDVAPSQLAYVIYTSGSTGTPKGVLVEHGSLCHTIAQQLPLFGLTPDSRVLATIAPAFDASLGEIFRTLLAGATLCMAAPDDVLPGPELVRLLRDQRITTATLVTSVLAALPEGDDLPDLRTITVGGEALPAEVAQRWGRGRHLLNGYGPSEATIGATLATVWDQATTPPLGPPLPNVRAYVVDAGGRLVPAGVPGELFLGGPGVARGYLGRPDLTAERFVPDPFGDQPGARLYRTGDRVRWRPDGELEFLGRVDEQVKVRGHRVEPSEVSAALRLHPAVRDAVVVARPRGTGELRLIAYVVADEEATREGPVDDQALRRELRDTLASRLPEYMLPSAMVRLDALPRSANGKLDRGALPEPDAEHDRASAQAEYVAPRTPVEAAIAAIWTQLLDVDRVGVHDNFFELGGDSILGIRVIARANEMGLSLTSQDVYRLQTVAEQAAGRGTAEAIVAEQGQVTGSPPLTPIQRWFFEANDPDPHLYTWAAFLPAPSGLSEADLRSAVRTLLEHHDALRLRFTRDAHGAWRQTFAMPTEAEEVPVIVLDGSTMPRDAGVAAVEASAAELQTTLDLERGPLLRVALFDRAADRRIMLVVAHHLVIDTVAWPILLGDLATLLRQAVRGEPSHLPPKTSSWAAWADALATHAGSDVLAEELPYWLDERMLNAAAIPVDRRRGANTRASGRELSVSLDRDTTGRLRRLASTRHTAPDEPILGALAVTLARWSGGRSVVNIERHGRDDLAGRVDLSRTVGWFASIAPFVLDIDARATPAVALEVVAREMRAMPDRGIGYGLLRYLAGEEIGATLRSRPEADVFFCYHGQQRAGRRGRSDGAALPTVAPTQSRAGLRRHLIEINAVIVEDALQLRWSFSANVHRRETIERLARGVADALRDIVRGGEGASGDGGSRADLA